MSTLIFYIRFLSTQVLSYNIRMVELKALVMGFATACDKMCFFNCVKVGPSTHVLTTKNIERIFIGVPKHILNMQNIYRDIMMMQNIHHNQLITFKKFYV